MDTDVLGKSLAASGAVTATPTRVRGLVVEPGTSTGSVEIKDGGSSGTSKFVINTVANGETFSVLIPANGVWCRTSAYATLSNAKVTVFYG
jgi:hypothetical protein